VLPAPTSVELEPVDGAEDPPDPVFVTVVDEPQAATPIAAAITAALAPMRRMVNVISFYC
jgi:hypothetical protein